MSQSAEGIPATLAECRAELDRIDGELIRLLARRFSVGLRAARIKSDAELPIVDEERAAKVVEQATTWAREAGLPEDDVADIFRRLVSVSGSVQLDSVRYKRDVPASPA